MHVLADMDAGDTAYVNYQEWGAAQAVIHAEMHILRLFSLLNNRAK